MILFSFLLFSFISSKFLNQNSFNHEQKISSLLNKAVVLQKEDENQTNKRISASITDKFHILSVNPSDIHINGGDEVEIQIDTPKAKEVYCKVGLKVIRGLNKNNKTMICLLPQLDRQVFDGKNTIFISLSFDKIHWCEPYSLNIIPEESSFSILSFLAFVSFGIVILTCIKMLLLDPIKKKNIFGRRKPPRKKLEAFSKDRKSDVVEDDPFVFNRKILGSSFL